ncbi:hypothetical protein [Pelagovum pacificum]|uniref:Capsular biosynthesis protein n=1 Tax=Pelagovum pacificum TaxID=2588711 RepID=A0A5C5GE00_9RHOB|nr:hypothetical protein [Pelagovum pacificum]QQA44632.1 hypothetical protein I8N54_08710 [Pelagovum pacificum]TNY32257.1 hypothetical protein FHY64_02885 [Pelagovum pacificum]
MSGDRDVDVILEVPVTWLGNAADGDRHRQLSASILIALAHLGVTVRPVQLQFGADRAPRLARPDQLVISYHSLGAGDNVLRFKESYVPPYYTVDPLGYSGYSELGQSPETFVSEVERFDLIRAVEFVSDLRERMIEGNASKYRQDDVEEWLPEDYVFFPLQTVEDTVAELARFDQLDALHAVAAHAGQSGRWLLVKRHPQCSSPRVTAALEEIGALERVQVVTGSIHRLIAGADVVVGCNSGVLFEALIHGVPVVSFGRSDFAMATAEVETLADLLGAIEGRGRADAGFVQKFVAWYLLDYCVAAGDLDAVQRKIEGALATLDIKSDGGSAAQLRLFDRAASAERLRRGRALRRT